MKIAASLKKSMTSAFMTAVGASLLFVLMAACGVPAKAEGDKKMDCSKLTPEEERVIVNKGTERPFTGKYVNHHEDGTYTCKRCGVPLFKSDAKFDSGSGWPSFDDALPGAVKQIADADGQRTEIVCAACGAHLGHVFVGERMTPKNVRHCVNSVALDFAAAAPEGKKMSQSANSSVEEAFFAGGCFWGVEYYFENEPGVLKAESGYMGGQMVNPTYQDVKTGRSGHAEVVRVTFNPAVTSYEKLARLFMEIHDPTQLFRQGPDIGNQYRSAIFVADEAQRAVAEKLITELKLKGFKVVTEVTPAAPFWIAEDYHQDYYEHKGTEPYCHSRVKRF